MKRYILLMLVAYLVLCGFTSGPSELDQKGHKAFQARRYTQAIQFYDRALKVNSKDIYALNGKGVTLAFAGSPKQGLKYINRALYIKPDYLSAYFNAGLANELAGDYISAILAYKKVIAHDAKNTWSHYGIACAYGQMGDVKNAVKHLKHAIALDKSVKLKARTEKDFNKVRKYQLFCEAVR